MSAIQQMLLAGKALTLVSGSLSGSGSLSIPVGATLISLTGAGGTGSVTNNPGQAYIASTPRTAGPNWSGSASDGTTSTINPITLSEPFPNPQNFTDTASGTSSSLPFYQDVGSYVAYGNNSFSVSTSQITAATPGQPYIAPSTTNNTGPSTTASLNGSTATFAGGSGNVSGNSNTQTLTSNGAGQSLTYSVGSGGALSYSYSY